MESPPVTATANLLAEEKLAPKVPKIPHQEQIVEKEEQEQKLEEGDDDEKPLSGIEISVNIWIWITWYILYFLFADKPLNEVPKQQQQQQQHHHVVFKLNDGKSETEAAVQVENKVRARIIDL